MAQSNRVMSMSVPRDEVFALLVAGSHWPDAISVAKRALPAGTEVLAVEYDMRARSFLFLLSHESWPEVPVGSQAPEFAGTHGWGTQYKTYEKKADPAPKTPTPAKTVSIFGDAYDEAVRRAKAYQDADPTIEYEVRRVFPDAATLTTRRAGQILWTTKQTFYANGRLVVESAAPGSVPNDAPRWK